MNRALPRLFTLFTPPSTTLIHNLFITPIRIGTGRIRKRLVLDKRHHGRYRKVVDLVVCPQAFILDLTNRLDFVQPDITSSGSVCTCDGRVGVGLEVGVGACGVVPTCQLPVSTGTIRLRSLKKDIAGYKWEVEHLPSPKSVSLVDIRVDSHRGTAEHAQTPPAEIAHLDAFESHHGEIVRAELLGLLAP